MASHGSTQETDDGTAVVAHGLLTSMSVVSAGIRTVWEHWADLSSDKRDHLFERILAHSTFVTDGLKDLSQGMPEGAAAELEAMQKRRPARPGAAPSRGNGG
jgi:hypothetical protein